MLSCASWLGEFLLQESFFFNPVFIVSICSLPSQELWLLSYDFHILLSLLSTLLSPHQHLYACGRVAKPHNPQPPRRFSHVCFCDRLFFISLSQLSSIYWGPLSGYDKTKSLEVEEDWLKSVLMEGWDAPCAWQHVVLLFHPVFWFILMRSFAFSWHSSQWFIAIYAYMCKKKKK